MKKSFRNHLSSSALYFQPPPTVVAVAQSSGLFPYSRVSELALSCSNRFHHHRFTDSMPMVMLSRINDDDVDDVDDILVATTCGVPVLSILP